MVSGSSLHRARKKSWCGGGKVSFTFQGTRDTDSRGRLLGSYLQLSILGQVAHLGCCRMKLGARVRVALAY